MEKNQFSPNSRTGNSVLRHHAYAWCPHHLIPVYPPFVHRMPAQHSVLRHHAYAWCPHHLIPVYPPFVHRMPAQHSVLRHHAYAWCPHHLIPVHPPPVRGGEYFANNSRCWATLRGTFGETPPYSLSRIQYFGLTPAEFLSRIRYFGTSLRCWATLRGTFGETPPYSRLPAIRSPNSCPEFGTSAPAYAWCPHHLIPVYPPSVYPPSVRDGEYFGTMLTHGVLTTLFLFSIRYFGTMLTHGVLTTLFLSVLGPRCEWRSHLGLRCIHPGLTIASHYIRQCSLIWIPPKNSYLTHFLSSYKNDLIHIIKRVDIVEQALIINSRFLCFILP